MNLTVLQYVFLIVIVSHSQGSLPFDDDNLRILLEKVKRGRFSIPSYVPSGPQELIRGMVDVNPRTRMTVSVIYIYIYICIYIVYIL